jgi:conjugal transfer pilus assembly protein TraE
MKKGFSDKKNDILAQQRNISVIIAFVLLVIDLMLVVLLLKRDATTILVPSSLTSSVSISTKRPHNTYLESFSRDVVYTMLNLTPNNVEYAEKAILSFAHGSAHGILKSQLERIKVSIMSKKFSTTFYPIAIFPDSTTMSVLVEGMLHTFLGQKEVERKKKKYEIKYDYTAGRLTIVGFSEIVEDINEIDIKNEK